MNDAQFEAMLDSKTGWKPITKTGLRLVFSEGKTCYEVQKLLGLPRNNALNDKIKMLKKEVEQAEYIASLR